MTPPAPLNFVRGIAGAIAGAVAGYFVFQFAVSEGYYMMVLPGALIGMGCGYLSGVKSIPLGIVAGIIALLTGLLLEWKFFPFIADDSLGYFLRNLSDLRRMDMIMIGVGTLLGFWFGQGRQRFASARSQSADR